MADSPIDSARIQKLNARGAGAGRYVLYWMQQSQRARCNHALEYAIYQANARGQPLVVGFGLTEDDPEANLRHFRFMLEGLAETEAALADRGIPLIVRRDRPHELAMALGTEASLIVCDRGYLRHQQQWRRRVAREARVAVVQVEADVVVPVEEASRKQEQAARTIRPRIHRQLARFLAEPPVLTLERTGDRLRLNGLNLNQLDLLLKRLELDRRVPPVRWARGGTSQALDRLQRFIAQGLSRYVEQGDQPDCDVVSRLSPYLHFGQVSPVEVAIQVDRAHKAGRAERDAYLEQLIVRRELACNFTQYSPDYDRYKGIPAWARRTLEQHRQDDRPHRYTRRQLEAGRTHDPYWNAAMMEMRHTGYLHNRMRMYWGKMILNWSGSPAYAYRTALMLNNRYFLDGRDPASFANVAWIFGLHDHPWPERPVFGQVRSMTTSGLERKIDTQAYLRAAKKHLEKEPEAPSAAS